MSVVGDVRKGLVFHQPSENIERKEDLVRNIRYVSKFDPSIEISRCVWTVTMVVDRGHFHVRLVFEGIGKGLSPFFRVAHLQGPKTWTNFGAILNCFSGWSKKGNIEIGKKIDHENLTLDRYRKKTETWARPREQIKLMVRAIKVEREKQQTHIIPFNFFGRRSVLAKEAELLETDHPELVELKKTNPRRFDYLAGLSEKAVLLKEIPRSIKDSTDYAGLAVRIIDRNNKVLIAVTILWTLYAISSVWDGIKALFAYGAVGGWGQWVGYAVQVWNERKY